MAAYLNLVQFFWLLALSSALWLRYSDPGVGIWAVEV